MKLIVLLLLATLTGAQTTAQDHPTTDAQKIADALRAGPAFITKGATILDWPATPGRLISSAPQRNERMDLPARRSRISTR
jgi:hypothetical protein